MTFLHLRVVLIFLCFVGVSTVVSHQSAAAADEAVAGVRAHDVDQLVIKSADQFPTQPKECSFKTLRFSADSFPKLPNRDSNIIWGGNATSGDAYLNPPYSPEFLNRAHLAKVNGLQTFAYFEGPCGDTGGVDDGERARCARLHRSFNKKFAPGTPDTPRERWKPYTMSQMLMSGQYGIDHCEIDNLSNNVRIPLIPLMREIKRLYDANKIHCQLVLKNIEVEELVAVKKAFPTLADAEFISPFHIYEANNTRQQGALKKAMVNLKGAGATTIISLDTNHYGSAFTHEQFQTCTRSLGRQ